MTHTSKSLSQQVSELTTRLESLERSLIAGLSFPLGSDLIMQHAFALGMI
ncbi:MAG: hypothetical protein R3C99_14400 [Pirellulaceae bacterium]